MNIEDKIVIALKATISAHTGTKKWCEKTGITEDELKQFLEFGKAAMAGYREGVEKWDK